MLTECQGQRTPSTVMVMANLSILNPLQMLYLTVLFLLLSGTSSAQPSIAPADFVIVGGGTAGCTVAAELCRLLPRATFTVLERGRPRTARERSLSLAARDLIKTWTEPGLSEVFQSEPNSGLSGRRVRVVLGSNIGGSSAVNAAKFTLPPPWYYTSLGIAGLGPAAAARLFGRVRTALRPAIPPPGAMPDYTYAWINAAVAAPARLPFLKAPLAPPRTNAGSWPPNTAFDPAGRRVDAYRGFLQPAMNGPCAGRVRVVRAAKVRRVRVRSGRAVAAEVSFPGGGVRVAVARRAVLLAAGAVNSAAVLQRSGVGPAPLLRGLGIPVVRDMPVGQHMQTRPVTVIASTYTARLARANNVTLLSKPWVRQAFAEGRGGPLSISPFGPNARLPGFGYVGMQIGFEGQRLRPGSDGGKRIGTSCLSNVGWNSFSTVRITSKYADKPPALDLRLLEEQEDLDRAIALMQKARQIHKGLESRIGAKEIFFRKGENQVSLAKDRAIIERKVRSDTYGANHYVGGCAVGRVVDARLRVQGIKGLRVVDTGAIRRIPPNAGPLGTVYIVALRAAEIIAEDNKDLME